MRARIRIAIFGGLACASLALCVPPAAAFQLGEIAPSGTTGSGNAVSFLQYSSAGQPSYTVPAIGTITQFFVRSGNNHQPGDFARLLVLRPAGPGAYTVVAASDPAMLSGQPLASRLGFPVTIAVQPGDVIGGQYVSNGGGDSPLMFTTASAGDVIHQISTYPFSAGDTVAAYDAGPNQRLNMEVDFQYADVFAPEISSFKALYKSFRVKPKGAVISKRAHPGTTVSLNLSEPADVTFTVEKGFAGKRVGGSCVRPTKRNARARGCTRWIFVHQFKRSLSTGPNAFYYSARYISPNNGKIGTLRPGPFRMRADAVDGVGNAGSATPLRFKIRS